MSSIVNQNRKMALVVLTFALAAFIRFYNFSERVIFGPEQAISLIVAGDNIKEKISLLGIPYIQRLTSDGHYLFASALFPYSLVPLQLALNYDPIKITVFFALLNLAVGFILFYFLNKVTNYLIALFSLIFFLFNDVMIYHSLFIWINNYLPLTGVLLIIFLWLFYLRKRDGKYSAFFSFLLGLIAGVSFGLQYLFLFTGILLFIFTIFLSKYRLTTIILFSLGAMIGNLPMILFDIKHDFYNMKTLWKYFIDTLSNPSQSYLNNYHFLHFYPLLFLIGGVLTYYIYRRWKLLAVGIIALYIISNVTSSKFSYFYSVGMLKGMDEAKFEEAAQIIAQDNPPTRFNVASLLDFDSRAHPLRYLVKFKYNLTPMGVEEYRDPQALYVFAKSGYRFDQALAWEVNVYHPFKVDILKNIDENYSVYKLTKQE